MLGFGVHLCWVLGRVYGGFLLDFEVVLECIYGGLWLGFGKGL